MARANVAVVPDLDQTDVPDTILEYSVDIAEQERPPVLPVGEYRASVTGVQKKYGKDSGRPYLNIRWTISSDNLPSDFLEALGTDDPVTVFQMVMGCEDHPRSRYVMHQFCEGRIQVDHSPDLNGEPRPQVRRVVRS
jgi:hypothetical protein